MVLCSKWICCRQPMLLGFFLLGETMGSDDNSSPKAVPTPLSLAGDLVAWLKRQSNETVILCLLLVALVYGTYLAGSALFHEIPRQIQNVTESHERAVDRVNASHERRSAEDKQLINKLLDRAGIVQARDSRNIAGDR